VFVASGILLNLAVVFFDHAVELIILVYLLIYPSRKYVVEN